MLKKKKKIGLAFSTENIQMSESEQWRRWSTLWALVTSKGGETLDQSARAALLLISSANTMGKVGNSSDSWPRQDTLGKVEY